MSNIIVFCAHNDDNLLGVGGTIAKYSREGIKTITVIFSYGESSNPWLKKKVTKEIRKRECEEANKIIKGGEIIYLGLKDGKLKQEIKNKNPRVKKKIEQTIKKFKPVKIFTHSPKDPHPDHKAVTDVLVEVLDELKKKEKRKYDVYTYRVWNPTSTSHSKFPKLVVDISNDFNTKLNALKCHRSQRITMFSLLWNIIRRDLFNGLKNKYTFAEVFYKIR